MDREEEEMQFVGQLGVYRESLKIISSRRKIMSQITLTLILPLSFIFLFHIEVSNLLFRKIKHNTEEMNEIQQESPQHQKLSDLLSSEWTVFFLFKLFYFTLLLIFSLLSTSAVVYTVASIYTASDVTFKKVLTVVPKVWKRLLLTFLCTFAAFLAYNLMAILVVIIWALTLGPTNAGIAFLVVILIFYYAGFVYLTVLWHLASVVTVLEDSYGIKAMMKSKDLIKGKMGLAILIFFKLNVSYLLIQLLFKKVVVHAWTLSSFDRTAYGILCFFFLSFLLLFWLVVQTVLYFVCKSYHHENIDKSALSDHLQVYLGEYEPLNPKHVQLQQYAHV